MCEYMLHVDSSLVVCILHQKSCWRIRSAAVLLLFGIDGIDQVNDILIQLTDLLQPEAERLIALRKGRALEYRRRSRKAIRCRRQQQAELIQGILFQKCPVERAASAYQHGAHAEKRIQLLGEQLAVQRVAAAGDIGNAPFVKIAAVSSRRIFNQDTVERCVGSQV